MHTRPWPITATSSTVLHAAPEDDYAAMDDWLLGRIAHFDEKARLEMVRRAKADQGNA